MSTASTVITSKQLFFSHYFVTGLGLTVLVRDPKGEEGAFYLVTFLRERTGGVGGMFGKMLKGKAEEAARQSVEEYLGASQAAIEKYYLDARARRGDR